MVMVLRDQIGKKVIELINKVSPSKEEPPLIRNRSQTGTDRGPFWGSWDDIPTKISGFAGGCFVQMAKQFVNFSAPCGQN